MDDREALAQSVAEAREAVFSKLTFADHMGSCPAHHERVRNTGPCNCGMDIEANDMLDALIAAVRAQERGRVMTDAEWEAKWPDTWQPKEGA